MAFHFIRFRVIPLNPKKYIMYLHWPKKCIFSYSFFSFYCLKCTHTYVCAFSLLLCCTLQYCCLRELYVNSPKFEPSNSSIGEDSLIILFCDLYNEPTFGKNYFGVWGLMLDGWKVHTFEKNPKECLNSNEWTRWMLSLWAYKSYQTTVNVTILTWK